MGKMGKLDGMGEWYLPGMSLGGWRGERKRKWNHPGMSYSDRGRGVDKKGRSCGRKHGIFQK